MYRLRQTTIHGAGNIVLGFQGGVSIPLVKGRVKATSAKRRCQAAPKAWLDAAILHAERLGLG